MALGRYSVATATGAIVATGSADALIWACRWTSAVARCLIERIRVNAVVTGTITTAVPYDLAAYFATAFTVAPTTDATAATLSGRNGKRKTSGVDTTLMGGIYTLTTVAAGMTGQTYTLDTQPLARISGATGTAIGSQFFGVGMPADLIRYKRDAYDRNENGIVLEAGEGLAIRAPLAGPATGTFRVCVNCDWREIS